MCSAARAKTAGLSFVPICAISRQTANDGQARLLPGLRCEAGDEPVHQEHLEGTRERGEEQDDSGNERTHQEHRPPSDLVHQDTGRERTTIAPNGVATKTNAAVERDTPKERANTGITGAIMLVPSASMIAGTYRERTSCRARGPCPGSLATGDNQQSASPSVERLWAPRF